MHALASLLGAAFSPSSPWYIGGEMNSLALLITPLAWETFTDVSKNHMTKWVRHFLPHDDVTAAYVTIMLQSLHDMGSLVRGEVGAIRV